MPGSDPAPVAGAVVRVPFPYTDAETRQHRPALVVATVGPGSGSPFLWVLMITSAGNRSWPGDIPIPDAEAAGLPAPSVIRTAKIATIDASRAERRGALDAATLAAVRSALSNHLALTS